MTSAFKNRLIGSSILIIAAIVFLPDLLDGQKQVVKDEFKACLLYTSPSPRDQRGSRMPSSA